MVGIMYILFANRLNINYLKSGFNQTHMINIIDQNLQFHKLFVLFFGGVGPGGGGGGVRQRLPSGWVVVFRFYFPILFFCVGDDLVLIAF
jgi:hypothetical protein